MYQKRSREIFKSLKAFAVFFLTLVLLLPAMPVQVHADEANVLLNVPYINQNDYTTCFYDKNGNVVKNTDDQIVSVQTSGCGAASSAMVVGFYRNTNADPNVFFQRAVDADLYKGDGLSHDTITYICAPDSVLVTWSSSINDAIDAIKNGRPVIAHMGPGTFTKHGHYIVLIGYRKDDNGNEFFQVNDPNHPTFCGREYPRSTITSEARGNGYGITANVGVNQLTVKPSMDDTTLDSGVSCNITGYVASNTTLTSVKGEILNSSGNVVQTITVNPNASYLDLKSSDVNMELKFGQLLDGSYTLRITATDANNKTLSNAIFFWVGDRASTSTPAPSLLMINSLSLDNTVIEIGNACNINGTASSNYLLTSVKGEILDSNGKVVQTVTVSPRTKSLDLRSSDVNMNLKFGKLDEGKYTLNITASDSAGICKKTISFKIVKPVPTPDVASTLAINGLKTETTQIVKGNPCNVLGTISSNYPILQAKGEIIGSNGKVVQSTTITPNVYSFSLRNSSLNSNLRFAQLDTGIYTLKVTATDKKKSISSSCTFYVMTQDPASTLAISSLSLATNPVTAGSATNVLGTVTSNYNITTVKGEIINSSGKAVQTTSISPNAKSVDIKSSALNTNLKIGNLTAGNYTLRVTATDTKTTVSSGYSFTVKNQDPASTLAITSLSLAANPIITSNPTNVLGTVSSNYTITTIKGQILNGSGSVVQTASISPNAKSVDLKSTGINSNLKFGNLAAGNYSLRVIATDAKKSVTANYSFTVKNQDPASTLAISSLSLATNPVTAGTGCNVLGTVSSNYTISTVKGEIINSSGRVVQTASISPNAKSVDIKSSALNTNLKIGNLSAGNYTLKVTATDAKKSVSSSYSFTVKNPDPASTLAITSLSLAANPIITGNPTNVLGTVSSNYTISTIKGQILNSSGSVVQTASISPNAKSVDLKSTGINSNLKFGSLAAGNYTLKVTATDAKKSVTANYSFTVKNADPASTLAISSLSLATNPVTAGTGCNVLGTISSNYNISTVTGQILNSSGSVVQTASISPNAKSVDIKSTALNTNLKIGNLSAGGYTLRVTATDAKKSVTSNYTFSVKNADPASTLSISLGMDTTSITQGNGCNITGTISSNYNITSVTGVFINSSGNVVQTASISPNSKSVDLKSSAINSNLKFGSLAAGNYTLKVTATDAKKTISSSKSFTIQGKSVAGLSGSIGMATTRVSYGSGCNITGSFSSGSRITSVTGKISNSQGTTVQTETIYPNATSVDLKSSAINSNLRFGKLSRGGYTLTITAVDAAGNTLTRNVTFSVV